MHNLVFSATQHWSKQHMILINFSLGQQTYCCTSLTEFYSWILNFYSSSFGETISTNFSNLTSACLILRLDHCRNLLFWQLKLATNNNTHHFQCRNNKFDCTFLNWIWFLHKTTFDFEDFQSYISTLLITKAQFCTTFRLLWFWSTLQIMHSTIWILSF